MGINATWLEQFVTSQKLNMNEFPKFLATHYVNIYNNKRKSLTHQVGEKRHSEEFGWYVLLYTN